ncbi:TPA: hypothetical protein LA460_000309 [Clostridium botulinum]|nr:hypothetical protein [Clostridium botulinum]HBJ1652913.1 hypothetical protein [Clostridium botulinum]
MKTKKSIRERITVDIFRIWDNQGAEFAVKELMKLYYKEYNKLSIFEEKRLILYNLICAEADCDNMEESVKLHSEELKKEMDNEKDYKINFPKLYARMLTAYRDTHLDELEDDEVDDINLFCYKAYENCQSIDSNYFLDMLNAKFNLFLFRKNFSMIFDIIKDMLIHNTDNKFEITLKQMYRDIKNTDLNLYNRIIQLKTEFNIDII